MWSGLCTSTVGEDLFRVASVWLAVEVAGNMVGLVTGVQYVAIGDLWLKNFVVERLARGAERPANFDEAHRLLRSKFTSSGRSA